MKRAFLRRILVLFALLPSSNFANAEGGGEQSQLFFQPQAGKISLELLGTFGSGDITYSNGTVVDVKVTEFGLEGQYGLTNEHAFGLRVGHETLSLDSLGSQSKEVGLQDLMFSYRGHSAISSIVLRFGGQFKYSLGKKKSSSATKDGTPNSGGMIFEPYVGLEVPAGSVTPGVSISQDFNMGMTVDNQDGTETEIREGNTMAITPYVEFDYGQGLVALYYSFLNTGIEERKTDNGTVSETESYKGSKIGLRGSFDILPEHVLLAGAEMSSSDDYQGSVDSEFKMTTFSLGYRFSF